MWIHCHSQSLYMKMSAKFCRNNTHLLQIPCVWYFLKGCRLGRKQAAFAVTNVDVDSWQDTPSTDKHFKETSWICIIRNSIYMNLVWTCLKYMWKIHDFIVETPRDVGLGWKQAPGTCSRARSTGCLVFFSLAGTHPSRDSPQSRDRDSHSLHPSSSPGLQPQPKLS